VTALLRLYERIINNLDAQAGPTAQPAFVLNFSVPGGYEEDTP
jgi:hypothetical protein